ncbi:MAG: NAD(+)/NADH kinase [Phycisphaerales bacterium]|nr:NAD(+)/NADH kinase [Phycisphaerales bacterium]
MNVVVLSNPKSGAGRARRLALQAIHALSSAGHRVKHLEVGGDELLDPVRLEKASALVVVGGDGTVLRCAEASAKADCPIYHLPTGNENLFSRQFGMTSDVRALRCAVEARRVSRVDLGRVRVGGIGEPFLLMCSVGPDAGVIRRLSRSRRRALGHASYTLPVLGEVLAPMLPMLGVQVDGQVLVEERRGWVIVANSAQYALGLNPLRRAQMDDGLVDVLFMPARSSLGCAHWLMRCARKSDLTGAGAIECRGRQVRIRVEAGGACYQVDGETASCVIDARGLEMEVSVDAGVVPVLSAP